MLLLTDRINKLKSDVVFCRQCHNISDHELCDICANPKRDSGVICVGVPSALAEMDTPRISPTMGPPMNHTKVHSTSRPRPSTRTSATVEGDTTNFFIYKNIQDKVPTITTIARGIGIGEELEYADEATLGRSILARTEFERAYQRDS